MPRTYRKKRTTKKRRRRKKTRSRVPRAPKQIDFSLGFPQKAKCVHRYVDTITLDPASSLTLAYHTFYANSMFDPDLSGGGHQPKLYDELGVYYRKSTVIGAKISVKPICTDTTGLSRSSDVPIRYGIVSAVTSDQLANMQWIDCAETKEVGKGCTLNNLDISRSPMCTKTWSLKKDTSHSGPLGDDVCTADFLSNPSEKHYFSIWCVSPAEAQNGAPIRFEVVLDQIAIWQDPRPISRS